MRLQVLGVADVDELGAAAVEADGNDPSGPEVEPVGRAERAARAREVAEVGQLDLVERGDAALAAGEALDVPGLEGPGRRAVGLLVVSSVTSRMLPLASDGLLWGRKFFALGRKELWWMKSL